MSPENKTLMYFVPTPVGNLEDITLRAIRILQEADIILAEDTRVTQRLLQHLKITPKQLISFHNHNEHQTVQFVIQKLNEGKVIAQVSDAGTPGISDPGFLLSRACLEAGIKTECLPGATAFVPALVKSGLPCDRFIFEGFLPHKKGRQTKLKWIAEESTSVILYESPYRLVKLLEEIKEHCGPERIVSVSREISKMFEETTTFSVEEQLKHYGNKEVKGEIVVIIAGKPD